MSRRTLTWLVALIAALHAASFLGAGPVDDDFIVFRYAHNWIDGAGLVFNPGERFEGFSAPLWVVLIAAAMKLGIDPVHASLTLSIASVAVAAWAVDALWRNRFPSSVWPVPALLVAASPAIAWHGVAGLGTTLLAALLALFAFLYERASVRKLEPWGAAAALALACLLRQECVLFAVPFAWHVWRHSRSRAPLLPFVALVAWTAFRLAYYDRLLPIPYTVKKLDAFHDLLYGLRYLGRATLESGVGVLVLLALFSGRRSSGPVRPAARAIVLGLVLHTVYVVWVGGDFMALGRFFVPTLPLLLTYGALGMRLGVGSRTARAMVFGVAIGVLQWTQFQRPQIFGEHDFFERRWVAIGRQLQRELPAGSTLALSPIGAIGFHSRLDIVDVLGLTHAGLLATAPDLMISMKGHHRHDGPWILDQSPDYVILGNGVRQPGTGRLDVNPWEADLYTDPRFARDYARWIVPIDGGAPLDLWVRAGRPVPPGANQAR